MTCDCVTGMRLRHLRLAGVRAPSGGAWPAGQWAAQRQAEARGGLEYLLTVGAPAGVIMLFALVAFALGRQVLTLISCIFRSGHTSTASGRISNMWKAVAGRTATVLRWQYYVQRNLYATIAVPYVLSSALMTPIEAALPDGAPRVHGKQAHWMTSFVRS